MGLVLIKNYQLSSDVDNFNTLIWTQRFRECGDFELTMHPNAILSDQAFEADDILMLDGSDYVMLIEDFALEESFDDTDLYVISGRSLESILTRRIVWQQTILTGNFQEGIKKLLDENAINPTDPDRKIQRLIFQYNNDPYITSLTIDAQFTGQNLYTSIGALCDVYDLGFKITLNDNYQFVFSLYSGVDRSYAQDVNPYVTFSDDNENLLGNSFSETYRSMKTITVVAGEGEGLERRRVIVTSANGAGSDLQRREMYTDARDISSNDGEVPPNEYELQLSQRGIEDIVENGQIIKEFDGQVDAFGMFVFGRDFFLGDILQIESQYGLQARARVIDFIYSEDLNGKESYPVFEILE